MRIHTLDLHFQGHPQIIAAFLVECGDELVLIETGPGSTLPTLLQQIKEKGFEPARIKHVFVTHIHLDHAGAAGWWAQQGATVYVHPRGAAHLIDPSKLMASATQVYGDAMERLWGDMLPAPADKVVALNDGQTVKIGRDVFTAIDTPGHARHHHAFLCGDVCFTGDVAGVRLPGCDYLSVAAAPPQFDPVAYNDSIEKLHALKLRKLYLTHFGEVTDVSNHLSRYALRVSQVHEWVERFMAGGLRGDALRKAFHEVEHAFAIEEGLSAADWKRYEAGNSTAMSADGIALYCAKAR